MKAPTAVIFDMDGVICHTNPFHDLAWKQFLANYGIPATEQEFQDHMYGKHNSYILSYFFQRKLEGEELNRLATEKEALFREIYRPHVEPVAGFLPFLHTLKQAGIKTGVATSAPVENMELIVPAVGIEDLMESKLAEHDVERHKPFPDVYLLSAKNLGVDPADCVVFEDSKSGVQAAINAGMKVVGVLTTYTAAELPPCDAYIHDYTEIDLEKLRNLFG